MRKAIIFFFIIIRSINLSAQSLINEAEVIADEFIQKHFIVYEGYSFSFDTRRVSDAIHSPTYDVISQFLRIQKEITPEPLTIADRLNMFTWKGSLRIKWDASRFIRSDYNKNFNQANWYDWVDENFIIIRFAKKKEEWKFYDLYNEDVMKYLGKGKPTKEQVELVLSRPNAE